MWNRQVILILCILYVGSSLGKTFRSNNIDYDYRVQSRRHSSNRGKSITSTARPLLQRYWHSFVRNFPTLRPLSWNITNPIGNIFNTGTQQIIETPVAMHYAIEEHGKIKTKTTKRKPSRNTNNRKRLQSRNYLSTYDNNYQQMQLQPLGLDHNRVMHFYEPSSGQYYALQIESQPYYYNSPYGNQYNAQYYYPYNQDNGYNSYGDEDDDDGSYEDESYYPHGGHSSQHGYDSEDGYDFESEYESEHGDYNNEYDESNMEYEDSAESTDNWGYNDEEIFTDRKLKGGSDSLHSIAGSKTKIQKHLLKPETEENVKKVLLTRDEKINDKREKNSTKKETEKQVIESVRNSLSSFKKNYDINRKMQSSNTNKNLRLAEKPSEIAKYYIFPSKFWL